MVVDFAPGGSSMAAVSAGGEVVIWNLAAQDPRISSEHQLGELGSIAWSEGWDTIVSATPDGELQVWNINDQSKIIGPNELLLGHSKRGDWVTRVAWDPSGARLASTLDEDVLVWDSETNSLLQRFTGHDALVGGVDWSIDGTKIASGDADGVIKIWDAASGSELVTADEHSSGITDLRWSPDGTYLASAGSLDDTIVLIDPTSGDVLHRLSGSGSGIWSIGWSPEGDSIAGGTTNGEVFFWDLDETEDGEPSRVLQRHLNWVSGISYSPDGKWLATSGADNRLVLTDLQSETAVTYPGHQGVVRSVEFSPDGARLASGARDNLVIIWDVSEPGANKEPMAVYAGHTNGVNDVRWSPDGQKVASGSDDGTVLLWPGVE
jgi:WD40 repeat protein